MKLRTRLTVWILAIVLLSGGVSYFVIRGFQQESRVKDFTSFADVLGQTVRNSIRHDMLVEQRENIKPTLRDLGRSELIVEIRVYAHPDQVIYSALEKENGLRIPRDKAVAQVFDTGKSVTRYERHYGVAVYSVLIPVPSERRCRGCHFGGQKVLGVVEVGLRTSELEERLADDARLTAVMLGVTYLVLLVLVLVFLRQSVVERVRVIVESIAEIARGNYGYRVNLSTRDEFGTMATTFNDMAARVERTIHALELAHDQLDRALMRFGKLLATTVNPNEIAELVTDELADSVGATEAAVLVRQSDDSLLALGRRNLAQELVSAYNAEPAVWGEVPYLPSRFPPEGIRLEEREAQAPFFKLSMLHPRKSFYAFPLTGPENLVGLVTLVPPDSGAISPTGQHTLELLCHEAAIAIENARLHQALGVASITDELTQTYNRRHFFTSMKEEIARAERYAGGFSLVLIDLDYFKLFNDAFGHLVGDRILRRVSHLVVGLVRASDRVFRYGGDEFAIILPDTPERSAVVLSERIREEIRRTDFVPQGETADFKLGASVGVVRYDRERFKGESDAIFKAVDDALYEAKASGRNRIVVG